MDRLAPLRKHLGRRRRELGLTQEKLAEIANVSVDRVKDLEGRRRSLVIPGNRQSPHDWEEFGRICKELDEVPDVLLRRFGLL